MNDTMTAASSVTDGAASPKRRSKHITIGAQLVATHTALHNALVDEEILALLADYGCDVAHLESGMAYYEAAMAAHQDIRVAQGEQQKRLADFHTTWAKAKRIYGHHLQTARHVFRTHVAAITGLMLRGRRLEPYVGWLKQADQFYDTLLESEEYVAQMAAAGINQQQLRYGQSLAQATRERRLRYESAVGSTKLAMRQRDEALWRLNRWFRTFRSVAYGALHDRPDLLRTLTLTK